MSQNSKSTKTIAAMLSMWLVFDTTGLAMQPLRDDELAEETGAGLAYPFENIRLEMANTSFIELTGDDPNAGSTTFRRGDLRYYGLSLTSGNTSAGGLSWAGGACTTGFFGLGCPRNSNAITHYSDFDNPFVLRVFNYNKYGATGNGLVDRTVLELIGPSKMEPFRWAFYGEVEAGRTMSATADDGYYSITGNTCQAGTGAACMLKAQNIILGRPASRLKPVSVGGSSDTGANANPYNGPVLRLMQYMGTTADNGTNPKSYGVQYESRLSGDYRLSVNASAIDGVRGNIPTFTNEEGLYFKNVQAYLPLGQLHYQALIFDDAQPGSTGTSVTNGNIAIEVTRIPNDVAAYTDFYSFTGGGAGSTNSGYNRSNRSDRYYETHGYVEWGDKFPGVAGGVSTVRFAGTDPDGPTLALNTANFPVATYITGSSPTQRTVNGYTVRSAGFQGAHSGTINCALANTTCSVAAGTIGDAIVANTREEVIGAGGMVFVSKNASSTWTVLNNQSQAENNTMGNMLYVANNSSASGSTWTYRYELQRDASYPGGSYNPMLTVNAINLGHSRVNGMLIQRMRIETLGGQ